ncbi:hypothetical protein [Saccharococcus caldoxylosilyticus]|jgi:beta-ureidopropionase|nr:hypothetical protein [Parageobacillus caldoxylosilyticus]BDG34428.1 hypothetical protein PcaKH15_03340 [Parageobacillus caldoxylosilyticus]BDG38200.1 hypothetical protein PcaKH16_03390 [Parageobacillus caldoxylosilyticus]BDG41989.1 hypothetical protein PcaKH35_03340 [Parageobacillus caldoxylosilyticus]
MAKFYGQSCLTDLRGNIMAIKSRDQDEVIIGAINQQVIQEVCDARNLIEIVIPKHT